MKRGNKLGQFYLLAAIILVGVLLGIATVTNYVITKQSDVKQGDIAEELKLEAENVIGNGIIDSSVNLEERLGEFAEEYASYFSEGYDVLFVYGDEEAIENGDLTIMSIFTTSDLNSISVRIGQSTPQFNIISQRISKETISFEKLEEDVLTVTIEDVNYQFKLNDGNLFYFIIQQPVVENEKK